MLKIIAGKWKGRLLTSPKGNITRPTAAMVRQAVFNICQHKISGVRFLDVCAGSGAMGFEALSRGADSALFIESHRFAQECIRKNGALLGMEATIVPTLKRLRGQFDIVYIDPPYEVSPRLFIDELVAYQLLAEGATIFIETKAKIASWDPLTIISSRLFSDVYVYECEFRKA
ncbi:MAG: methyltransferase [Chlamydiota bacterium]|jgi:16S rRNA (guanine(966)-N(2))-methyltransferase RsmD